MTLLAILTGGTFVHYLFGGSVPIMGVFLTMVGLDLFTGYTKALNSHTWVSSINLNGLFTKFITFSTIICAAGLRQTGSHCGNRFAHQCRFDLDCSLDSV